ncbi:Serologically defined colon cancer antigen 8-like protein [Ooceraea biroi]|uniref:Serologically defined colon cancer antigen 8-like protein n=1 Tax=Ooceraea biroi TaxID=2015173 RepID=A0A026WX91_OOCBI|nr:Serologically defined colon cancer antigen 8-like protein [Ooceraea biroi]
MDLKRKPTDYMELAYREAISKLKYLLNESYIGPTGMSGTKSQSIWHVYKGSNARVNESGEDTDDPSMTSGSLRNLRSRKELAENLAMSHTLSHRFSKTVHPSKAYNNIALLRADLQSVPPELTSFIERQEDYIEQLERESQYCRDELMNLLGRVKEVVAENDALHSKNHGALSKCILQNHKDCRECSNRQDANGQISDNSDSKRPRERPFAREGPSIMLESRISELEAQLTQTKLELRKAQEENQTNLKRLSEGTWSEGGIAELKAELDKALRAKYEAEMKLDELQKLLSAARDKETEATQRARRSIDDRHQVEFERGQSEMEIRRLKDELERQHEKLREAAQETNRRITEDRQQAERRCNQQIEQLTADVASHWETANKSQLESEKLRRENNELRRESAQKQSAMDNLKKELQSKISTLQSDLSQALSEKDAAEQEVLTGKLTAERNERQARQEQSRLQAEVNSYKQRLERADADLVHCRRENLRLSEQIASLEKEISMSKIAHPEESREQITSRLENEKQLSSMIMDMQTKHAATVAGLEDALNNQATLVSRLTAECQSLTQRLEANNLKHKKEMADLQSNVKHLSNKIQGTLASDEGGISVEMHNANEINDRYDNSTTGAWYADGSAIDETNARVADSANDDQRAMDSETSKRNDQPRQNFYDMSSGQTRSVITEEDEPARASDTMEITGRYTGQEGDASAYTMDVDPNTYMVEQEYDQYNEYDPSRYQQEQYVDDDRFNELAEEEQPEDNRTILNTGASDTLQ